MPIPVVTIIGKSGSGKTTLMEGLIPELSRRGYRIATIKHHSHSGFEVDQPGKDSWRYAQAGSVHVIIAAPDKIASYRPLIAELTLAEIVQEVREADPICRGNRCQRGMQDQDGSEHTDSNQQSGQGPGDPAPADEQVQSTLAKPGGSQHGTAEIPQFQDQATKDQTEDDLVQRSEAEPEQTDGPDQQI